MVLVLLPVPKEPPLAGGSFGTLQQDFGSLPKIYFFAIRALSFGKLRKIKPSSALSVPVTRKASRKGRPIQLPRRGRRIAAGDPLFILPYHMPLRFCLPVRQWKKQSAD